MKIEPANNADGVTPVLARWFVEQPCGWIAAHDREALEDVARRLEVAQRMADALRSVLKRDQRNTCQHDETRRGGAIWEICCLCGQK